MFCVHRCEQNRYFKILDIITVSPIVIITALRKALEKPQYARCSRLDIVLNSCTVSQVDQFAKFHQGLLLFKARRETVRLEKIEILETHFCVS